MRTKTGSASGISQETDPKTDSPPAGVDTATGESEAPPPLETKAPPKVEQVELKKKIVAKEIVPRKELIYKKTNIAEKGEPEVWKVENDAPRSLYTVFGVAGGTIKGDSTFGPWLAFTGSFEAVRLSDRTRFKSDKLFLQDPAEGLLLGAISAAKRDDANATVGFAFEIGVKYSQRWLDTDQGNTYEYTVKSVFEVSQHDPLVQLRQAVMPTLPALPAPNPGT